MSNYILVNIITAISEIDQYYILIFARKLEVIRRIDR